MTSFVVKGLSNHSTYLNRECDNTNVMNHKRISVVFSPFRTLHVPKSTCACCPIGGSGTASYCRICTVREIPYSSRREATYIRTVLSPTLTSGYCSFNQS